MDTILIRDAFIATMDPQRTVHRRANLVVRGDRIAAVGPGVTPDEPPDRVIDGRHRVVLPGFVNCHAHLQQYFRGIYERIGDFFRVNLPLEGYRRPEDMAKLGLASWAVFIYGGCTTVQLLYTYPYEFAAAVERTGLRAMLGADIEEVDLARLMEGVYEYRPEKAAAGLQRARDLLRDWHGRADGRITTVMAPKAPDLATADTYRRCAALAREHGLRMTTHLAQNWREVQQVKRLHGKTPPAHLNDLGVLDARLSAAHCAFMTEADTQLMAARGSAVLQCLMPHAPIAAWMARGIPLGLGTDDYHHDMFQLIRTNMVNQDWRARNAGGADEMMAGDRTTVTPDIPAYLELATRRGAEVLGLGAITGSLEVGKKADIITIDMRNPYLTPTSDPLTSVALYAGPADVDTVMVDGRLLKHDRRLTTVDMAAALEDAQWKVDEIIARFLRDHPDQFAVWRRMAPYMQS